MAVSFSVEYRTVLHWLIFLLDHMLLMVCWWLTLLLHFLQKKKKWLKLGSWESPNVTSELQFTVVTPIIRSNYFCVVSAWEHGLSGCQEAAVLGALFWSVEGREASVNNTFHLQKTHNSHGGILSHDTRICDT